MRIKRDHLVAAMTLAASLATLGTVNAQMVQVTGTVVNSLGVGVSDVDLDFGIPVAGSHTGIGGVFSFMVQADKYDIGFKPPSAQLAPRQLLDVQIGGAGLNMGVIQLQPGFAVTGTALSRGGAPLPLVDLNVVDAGGNVLYTPDDNSDISGNFQVVVPGGTYDFRLIPTPASGFAPQEIEAVAVGAPATLGTITMFPGHAVTGRVIHSQTLLPVGNVDLDVEDAVSGKLLFTPRDNTDGLGLFDLFLPAGLFHVSFEPPSASSLVGRQRFNLLVTAPKSLGDVALDPGFTIAGVVVNSEGGAVAGADIDIVRAPDGNRVFTPDDKTRFNGTYSVVVPAGSYVLRVQPPVATGLVGVEIPMTVTGPITVQPINLSAGVLLSGTIMSPFGIPEVGADIDIINPITGAEIVLSEDDTDELGRYEVVVPIGTWDIGIDTRQLSPAEVETLPSVPVAGPTVRDHSLSLITVGAFMETFGIPNIPNGGLLIVNLATMNLTLAPVFTEVSLVLIDPDGGETPLLPPTFFDLPAQFPIAGFGVPVPLPPVNPAHLGELFRLELRMSDPFSNSKEFDRDNVKFVIR